MFEVYCLTSPSGKRYVGITARGAKRRLTEHARDARRGSPLPLHRAIRKHGVATFQLSLLERMSTEAGAHRAERLWIAELGTFGAGYNSTAGGEGMLGHRHTPGARAKITAAGIGRPSGMLGKRQTPEARALIAAAQTGRPATRGRTGVPASPESRAKASAAWTPEMRAAMSSRMRERQLGHSPSLETREKMRQAKLGRTLSKETRDRMSAAQFARSAKVKL